MKEKKGIKISLIKITKDKEEKVSDLVAREVPFSIFLNGTKIVTLQCTPENYRYLGVGFLYASGFIQKKENIQSIKIDDKQNLMNLKLKNASFIPEDTMKSSLQIGIYQTENRKKELPFNDFPLHIKKNQVFKLISKMQEKAEFFRLTGGTHSCALADINSSILIFSEDISRYNTVDKILGEAFIKDITMTDKIILTSCRITSGILFKIMSAKIPIIISRAATTDYAIKLAKQSGITLAGFVRGEKMNIYSHPERIEI